MKSRGIQLQDKIFVNEQIDLKIEVVRDADGKIVQGLVVGNIENQNRALIITANPGEFKQHPTLGAAIDDLELDDDYLRMRHRIVEELTKDGMKVKSVDFSNKTPLLIDASYE